MLLMKAQTAEAARAELREVLNGGGPLSLLTLTSGGVDPDRAARLAEELARAESEAAERGIGGIAPYQVSAESASFILETLREASKEPEPELEIEDEEDEEDEIAALAEKLTSMGDGAISQLIAAVLARRIA